MNGLKKPFKESNPKNRNQSEIAAREQKTTSEKAIFCSNTAFLLYFKIRVKKFHATKPLAFSPHFPFRRGAGQEMANNGLSYRCAAIINSYRYAAFKKVQTLDPMKKSKKN